MINFNTQVFVDCAKELLRADETERALWLLNNLPAYYRDHTPLEVIQLKNEVIKRIATPTLYANGDIEDIIDLKDGHGMGQCLRGQMLKKECELFNVQGITPHIIDYGPGEYWLPIVLKNAGYKFTYEPIFLNTKAHKTISPFLADIPNKALDGAPRVFVALEIIEHLWNEQDIKTEMLAHGGHAHVIHISTPRYTFDVDCKDWTVKQDLGHLRAYTPKEFSNKLDQIFFEYDGAYYDHQIMHARLILKQNMAVKLDSRWESL